MGNALFLTKPAAALSDAAARSAFPGCKLCCGEPGGVVDQPIRVLLVSRQTLFREGLAALLDKAPCVQVVGHADTGETALMMLQECAPDLVLVDSHLSGLSSVDVTFAIAAFAPAIRVLALISPGDASRCLSLLQAGAFTHVCQWDSLSQLMDAIHQDFGKNCNSPDPALSNAVGREVAVGKGAGRKENLHR